MKRHNATPIHALLDAWLRSEGIETPLLQYRLVNCWAEVMGPGVARYTGEIYIRDTTLHVQIKSAALRANLQMMRSDIISRLNGHVHAQVISNISFH